MRRFLLIILVLIIAAGGVTVAISLHHPPMRLMPPPAVVLDDSMGDAQAEAGAYSDALGGEERLEDPLEVLRRDARAGVRDLDDGAASDELRSPLRSGVVLAHLDQQLAAVRHRVDPVDDEVRDRLLDLGDVDPQLHPSFESDLHVDA